MENAIEYKATGIKCDNPDCDYKNKRVTLKNFGKWVNKPCPKCGCILLTEPDYRTAKNILKITKAINVITKPLMIFKKNPKREKLKIEMDGTGMIDIKKVK